MTFHLLLIAFLTLLNSSVSNLLFWQSSGQLYRSSHIEVFPHPHLIQYSLTKYKLVSTL